MEKLIEALKIIVIMTAVGISAVNFVHLSDWNVREAPIFLNLAIVWTVAFILLGLIWWYEKKHVK